MRRRRFLRIIQEGRFERVGERNHIQNILNGANGDRKKAASMLGVSKTTLYRKIKEHNL